MLYCKKCLLPDTRPGSIFDKNGICQACINFEKRKKINWKKRLEELKKLCNKYRQKNGSYDCLIPVSGGKDSHFLVYTMRVEMKMNPLLITIGDPFTKTEAGAKNLQNLGEAFNCDHILFYLSPDVFRRATRLAFEKFGEPLRFIETAIYTVPIKMSIKLGIPLVVFGENPAYEYGTSDQDNYSALNYILAMFKKIDIGFWLKQGLSKKEINAIIPPTTIELKAVKPNPIFMGYFTPWSSVNHFVIARKFGFMDLTHEWKREGCIDDFEQIDSIGYMVHHWLKYPKFGFQRTSDIVSRQLREGLINLDEGKRLIMEYDRRLDQRALEDFINFLGYSPSQFWNIVEKYWNRKIFKKVDDVWQLKEPVYKDLFKKYLHLWTLRRKSVQ